MKINHLLLVGMLSTVISSPMAIAADNVSPEQQKQIEKVVHDYLVNNPEVLVEVSQALQQKQQQAMQEQAKTAIAENADKLFDGSLTVAGNPKGNVTLVEFFDYQCIHCKKMTSVVKNLIKKDKNLRVVYREFPIFGKSSELASQVVLAAAMQGKYQQLHDALLNETKRLDDALIMTKAKSIGLNMSKLQQDMKSKTVEDELSASRELAEKLHLMGTPAFIIASTPDGKFTNASEPAFVPGAATEEVLQEMINKASKKA